MPAPHQREAEALAMTRERPTPQDNVEIARQGFETYNRYGIRAVAEEHWHPDVEWHVGPWAVVFGGQTRFRGREAGIAAIRELEAVMGQFTVDVLDAVQGPEGVFVAVRLHGKGAGSGIAVEQHFWYAIEIDEEWERRIRVCGDPVEALEAVGVREHGDGSSTRRRGGLSG